MKIRYFLISLFLFNIFTSPKENISINADSAVLMDPWTKRLLYSKNPHKRLAPASTVKLMTALLAVNKTSLKKKITVSRLAASMEPSKINIREGEVYFMEDLLSAILLSSANDASVAIAEGIAGSEEEFSRMMNEFSGAIGLENTHFKNASGLPAKGQYSTAYDLAIIVREAMKYKKIVDIIATKNTEIKEVTSGRNINLRNHNKSLWKDLSYLLLGKTGYTRAARHCFAGFIKYNKWRKVIVVMLKGKKLWSDLEILGGSLR